MLVASETASRTSAGSASTSSPAPSSSSDRSALAASCAAVSSEISCWASASATSLRCDLQFELAERHARFAQNLDRLVHRRPLRSAYRSTEATGGRGRIYRVTPLFPEVTGEV